MKINVTLTALALSLVLAAAPAGAQISCEEVTQANTDRVQKEQSKHDQSGENGGLDDIYKEASEAAGDQQSCMSQIAQAMQGVVPGGDWGGLTKIFQSKACEAVKSAQGRIAPSFSVNAPGVNLPAPQQQPQAEPEPIPAPQLPEAQPGKSLLEQALDSFGRS